MVHNLAVMKLDLILAVMVTKGEYYIQFHSGHPRATLDIAQRLQGGGERCAPGLCRQGWTPLGNGFTSFP